MHIFLLVKEMCPVLSLQMGVEVNLPKRNNVTKIQQAMTKKLLKRGKVA